MAGENLCEEIGSKFDDDSEILQFSYGKQNLYRIEDVRKIWSDDLEKSIESAVAKYDVSGTQCDVSEDEADAQKIINIIGNDARPDKINKTIWFVAEYFDKSSKIDEIRAKRKEDRIYGISTGNLIRNFHIITGETGQSDIDFYSEVIKYMDSGIASLTVKNYKVNGEERIASFLNAGEQAYRIKIDKYMQIFEYLSKIERDCINLQISSSLEKRVDSFICNALADENDREVKETDINAIREGMRNQHSSYSSMFVSRDYNNEELKKRDKYEKIYHEVMR